ncbi:MAG TPA: lipid A biosynthesis acyltransferase [Gammaproteobacteria bacterium]|nr:lipid A biosynthesis acyltransferase [Gammaproteobacteria bacterium]
MHRTPPLPPGETGLVLLLRLLSRLPLPLLYGLADLAWLLVWKLGRWKRALTLDNLRSSFPHRDERELARIASAAWRNALDVLFETLHGRHMRADALRARVQFENPGQMNELLERHGRVLAVAAHQGNWEWLEMASSLVMPAPLVTLYKPLNHPGAERFLNDIRERFGGRMVPARHALRELLPFTRRGGIVALLADQGPQPGEEKYWTDFLGRETAFYPGVEKLARRLRMPLLFTRVTRRGRGHYQVRFELLAEYPEQLAPGECMARYVRAVEAQVREHPEDWLWMYKRWKYRREPTSISLSSKRA